MSLLTDLRAEIGTIDSDIESLASLVWGDLKAALGAGASALVADLPQFASYLKEYAGTVVADVQSNPAFAGAVGSWKLGIAANMLFQQVKAGLPGFEKFAMVLGQAAVETAIQAAVAGLLAGL